MGSRDQIKAAAFFGVILSHTRIRGDMACIAEIAFSSSPNAPLDGQRNHASCPPNVQGHLRTRVKVCECKKALPNRDQIKCAYSLEQGAAPPFF